MFCCLQYLSLTLFVYSFAFSDELLTHRMARARSAPKKAKLEFTIHSLSLTRETEDILQRLSGDASDYIGRAVSNSAIVRALLRQVDQQGPPGTDALFVQVEKELKSGVMWGKESELLTHGKQHGPWSDGDPSGLST
jgi:hypothetical protein